MPERHRSNITRAASSPAANDAQRESPAADDAQPESPAPADAQTD
jgi:hypothetical protein